MAIVKGKAYWAYINEPNVKFEPTYTIDLQVNSEIAEEFKEKGFSVKQMDNGPALVIKRKVNNKGYINSAPKLFNLDKQEIKAKVKNGSNVRVEYREWEVTNQFGNFKGLELRAVQLIDPVEELTEDGQELIK